MIIYIDLKDKGQSGTLSFMTILEALIDEITQRIKLTSPEDLHFIIKADMKISKY
jgi:hypothetical protein